MFASRPSVSLRLATFVTSLALVLGIVPASGVSAVTGDVFLTEVLGSHTGTDDTEFVELFGVPGTALGGLSLIITEGDAGTSQGTIDRRIDFAAGATVGGNGYFLVGNRRERDVAIMMGINPSNPIGMAATDGLVRLIEMVQSRTLPS